MPVSMDEDDTNSWLGVTEVCALLSLNPSGLKAMIDKGLMAKGTRIGPAKLGWKLRQVDEFQNRVRGGTNVIQLGPKHQSQNQRKVMV